MESMRNLPGARGRWPLLLVLLAGPVLAHSPPSGSSRDRATPPRFEDCGDGTVADHRTGLLWEKKTDGAGPHDVNRTYYWSATGSEPDGDLFTEFLAQLNGTFDPVNPAGCLANRCDWRLPEISELQTILVGEDAAPGQTETCSREVLCADPDFATAAGQLPMTSWIAGYWSASVSPDNPRYVWFANFYNGNVYAFYKTSRYHARAVRSGSCIEVRGSEPENRPRRRGRRAD